MKINREEFAGVIQRVAGQIKTRSTIPILSCVRIQAINGGFKAQASDLDTFIEASCCCDGELEACCVAPGPLLALSSYGPDTMELSMNETRLKVVSGAMATLSVASAEEFPPWPDGGKDLVVNASDLADGINAVKWAADPRSEQGIMRKSIGVDLVTKANKIAVFACDGKELGCYSKPAIVPNAKFVALSESVGPLCEAMKGTNPTIKLDDNWIVVSSEGFRCAIGLVEGEFPNLKPITDMESEYMCELPIEATIEALTAMKSFSNVDEHVFAQCSANGKGLEFEFVGKTSGFRAVVDCVLSNKPKAPVRYDAVRLHDVLKNMPGEMVKFSLNDTQMRFESGDLLAILAQVKG